MRLVIALFYSYKPKALMQVLFIYGCTLNFNLVFIHGGQILIWHLSILGKLIF